ncbi:MAG: NAD(P)/FAD-dependent oxidoreductase [Pseudomonadota bacterium]
MSDPFTEHKKLVIIGAGFGGIGMAARLVQSGERDFVLLEKSDGVGGTWWVNRYPGCACDVPSHLYSFSFAPNPNWSRRFAPRHEIQAYLEQCVRQFNLNGHLHLNRAVRTLRWDDRHRHWQIADQHGQTITADFVISAIGGLSRPGWPDIPGMQSFGGQVIHSQLWHGEDLKNQRVAVIGTGASAVQFVPQIAHEAKQLTIFQRTPNWILPRPDQAISSARKKRFARWPWLQKLARFGIWLIAECRVPGLMWSNRLAWGHRLLARRHLRRQIPNPELRKKLTPDYAIGCKRVLLSSDYYPALMRTNVELIDTPIACIEPDAVVDASGRRHTIDMLILATGFRATEPVPRGMIIGRDDQDLHQTWREGPQAYRGTNVTGFPNLFMLLGPNTALGHNSVVVMIEAQIDYTLKALEYMQQNQLVSMDIQPEAQRRYNDRLQRKLARSVWNTGSCGSWYLHPQSGLNTTLWPGFTWQYRWLMRRFRWKDFEFDSEF